MTSLTPVSTVPRTATEFLQDQLERYLGAYPGMAPNAIRKEIYLELETNALRPTITAKKVFKVIRSIEKDDSVRTISGIVELSLRASELAQQVDSLWPLLTISDPKTVPYLVSLSEFYSTFATRAGMWLATKRRYEQEQQDLELQRRETSDWSRSRTAVSLKEMKDWWYNRVDG